MRAYIGERFEIVVVLVVVLIMPLSVYGGGFGSFLRKLEKNVSSGSRSSSSSSHSTRKSSSSSGDYDEVLGMIKTLTTRPERMNIEDEVGYGDTITAKMIQFYGNRLLDPRRYAGVWKYCNLIVQALGKTNVMRPKLSIDSTYTSKRIKNARGEDKKLFDNIGWHVGIIKSDDIGAVSAPGGYVLVTTGLLKACRCEAELAGVIAHEMAHISRSHGLAIIRKQINKRLPVAILGAVTGGEEDMIGAAVGALDSYVSGFAYGRNEEFEADRYGAQIMYRTGYNPYAFAEFVSSLKSGESRAYKSHPSSRDRAKRLNIYIKARLSGAEELPILQERYDKEVRKKLVR